MWNGNSWKPFPLYSYVFIHEFHSYSNLSHCQIQYFLEYELLRITSWERVAAFRWFMDSHAYLLGHCEVWLLDSAFGLILQNFSWVLMSWGHCTIKHNYLNQQNTISTKWPHGPWPGERSPTTHLWTKENIFSSTQGKVISSFDFGCQGKAKNPWGMVDEGCAS